MLCALWTGVALADFTVTIKDNVGDPNVGHVYQPGDTLTVFVEIASDNPADLPIIVGQFFIEEFWDMQWVSSASWSFHPSFTVDYDPVSPYTFYGFPYVNGSPFTPGDNADEWGATDLSFVGVGGGNTSFVFLTLTLDISNAAWAYRGSSVYLFVTDLIFGDSSFNQVVATSGQWYRVFLVPAPGAVVLGALGLTLVGGLKRRRRPDLPASADDLLTGTDQASEPRPSVPAIVA